MSPAPKERLADLNVPELYQRLDARRQEQGLSWREVSRRTGVGLMTLSRLANDSGTPNVDNLAQLLTWLGEPAFWYRVRPRPITRKEFAP